ncbi:MAG: N-acetyl-gamma-glutamyl-phosphate reductase [Rhodospirillaceae bacterium]|nr:N-acetyl-gamma-glutamyl-phosphate reductase [Rhodospirillaceae bacterium]|tara:strand:- start:820 stop:1863 length:1044 start_codon:yes stop_codon:yes gene_type:complete
MVANEINIAVLGASGYTGAEIVRILALHPLARIKVLTADRNADQEMDDVYPHLVGQRLPKLKRVDDVDFANIDVIFCGLPHGASHQVIGRLNPKNKLIDLSPDFRFMDVNIYEKWYGEHKAPGIQKSFVYGLSELNREKLKRASFVANPGCYPTSCILPLAPLLSFELINSDDIVIDAKSGVSGAGRSPNEAHLFGEIAEGVHAYGVGSHRHMPEIEQELSNAAGRAVFVRFTPHLMPMSRGILATIYISLNKNYTVVDLKSTLEDYYKHDEFIKILPGKRLPSTRHVRGSNFCFINVFEDRLAGKAIIISAIDNLVKGASGQAIQNMNIMLGLKETTAIVQQPLFP